MSSRLKISMWPPCMPMNAPADKPFSASSIRNSTQRAASRVAWIRRARDRPAEALASVDHPLVAFVDGIDDNTTAEHRAHHGPQRGVHAGRVAATGEDTDSLRSRACHRRRLSIPRSAPPSRPGGSSSPSRCRTRRRQRAAHPPALRSAAGPRWTSAGHRRSATRPTPPPARPSPP